MNGLRTSCFRGLLMTSVMLAGCDSGGEAISPSDTVNELINRNWLDVWPQSKEDRLHVFRFTPSMGGGVFQERNVFEGTFELFTFEASGDQLRLVFPGRGEQHTTPYRIDRVDGPMPFTRRLTLEDSPRGPSVYFGYDEKQTTSPFVVEPPL